MSKYHFVVFLDVGDFDDWSMIVSRSPAGSKVRSQIGMNYIINTASYEDRFLLKIGHIIGLLDTKTKFFFRSY